MNNELHYVTEPRIIDGEWITGIIWETPCHKQIPNLGVVGMADHWI